jgi:molybdopterin-guanine dinucleotide biosynthesis protein A
MTSNDRTPVVGVILAGGLSRRMGGGDKALLPLAGATMLERVLARLAPQVDSVVINANGNADRFDAFGLPVVADPVPGFPGPLAGVLAGMRWAAPARHRRPMC